MLETIEGDCLILRSHHCSAEFLRKMTKLREEGLYIDVRLKVFDQNAEKDEIRSNDEIIAHKLVLSCCSPYFEAMFSNKFADNGKDILTEWFFLPKVVFKTKSSEFQHTSVFLISE